MNRKFPIDLSAFVLGGLTLLGDEINGFTGTGAEARFNSNTRILEIDSDGDANVDMEIELTNVENANLDDNDFITVVL